MATPNRKRNNARKAAARAYQREHPGIRYQAALNQVTNDDVATPAANAGTDGGARLSSLLGISSVDDVLARCQAPVADRQSDAIHSGDRWYGYDGVAPLGFTDDGKLVTINVGPDLTYGGDGPHGAIGGINTAAHELAAVIALALKAKNADLQVAYINPGPDDGPKDWWDRDFRGADARERSAAWIAGALHHRMKLAHDAQAHDIGQMRELTRRGIADAEAVPRVLVVAVDVPDEPGYETRQDRWVNMLTSLAEQGRAADMFLLLLLPNVQTPALLRLRQHIGYRIAVGPFRGSFGPFDDLLVNDERRQHNHEIPDDTAFLSVRGHDCTRFTPLMFDSQLLENVTQARNQPTHNTTQQKVDP